MITSNTKNNINSNKISVDKYNTQMTTQKKISRPSEDPVVAIRALRLGTTLDHINQYVDNNIPDAQAWLDVTETAMNNMKSILTDIRTQCVNGSTDTLTADDRNTILKELTSLRDQVYSEGNADYAGRTVFTGYRTSDNLTFDRDETAVTYQIKENFTYSDMKEHRYYGGKVEVPADAATPCDTEITRSYYNRIRLAYDGTTELGSVSYTIGGNTTSLVDANGNPAANVRVFDSQVAWEEASGDQTCVVGDDDVVFLKDSGELVLGNNIAEAIRSGRGTVEVNYTKRGFDKGDVRPEYYFDCTDVTDPANAVTYTKEDQPINYAIANSTTLTINTQADQIFDTSIARDVDEMLVVVQKAVNAHDTVDRITQMLSEAQYAGDEEQAILKGYLSAAQKEADYADDNLQRTYSQYITNFDQYLKQVNIGITNLGSTVNRLNMTKTRVENQQMTVKELRSSNEDRDISDIMIDYYAAYNAYQSSLIAAGKINEQTLLNYL